MNLQQLKQEAREELHEKFDWDSLFGKNSRAERGVADYLDTLIDKVVDAVEASVVPLPANPKEDGVSQQFATGWLRATECMQMAFRNFKGV